MRPVLRRQHAPDILVSIVVQLCGKVIRDVPVSLIKAKPALEVRAALSSVNRYGQLWRQQLYIAPLEVGYLVLAAFVPDEVPDAVGRGRRLARLEHWRVLGRRLAQVMVRSIQSSTIERFAQAWVVVVGALEVPVVRVRGILTEHTLACKCCVFHV